MKNPQRKYYYVGITETGRAEIKHTARPILEPWLFVIGGWHGKGGKARAEKEARHWNKRLEAGLLEQQREFWPTKNPGAAWHKMQKQRAIQTGKTAPRGSAAHAFHTGQYSAHDLSEAVSRGMGMNPRREKGQRFAIGDRVFMRGAGEYRAQEFDGVIRRRGAKGLYTVDYKVPGLWGEYTAIVPARRLRSASGEKNPRKNYLDLDTAIKGIRRVLRKKGFKGSIKRGTGTGYGNIKIRGTGKWGEFTPDEFALLKGLGIPTGSNLAIIMADSREYFYDLIVREKNPVPRRRKAKRKRLHKVGMPGTERMMRALAPKRRQNPQRGGVEIYDRLMEIRARKGRRGAYPGEQFYHKFRAGARVLGMPDGSIKIVGKRGQRLWGTFKAK